MDGLHGLSRIELDDLVILIVLVKKARQRESAFISAQGGKSSVESRSREAFGPCRGSWG